jgi:hypothetical protein
LRTTSFSALASASWASLAGPCALGVFDRVHIGRVLRQAGKHGALGNVQFAQGLAKVGLRRFGKAVGTGAQIDLVHVERQDLVLAQLMLDLD